MKSSFNLKLSVVAAASLALLCAPGAMAKTKVTIATYSQPRFTIMTEQLLPQWQKEYPHIEFDIQMYPDFFNKMLTMMATDAAPDIVDTAGTYLFGHVLRGGAVDLAPYMDRDASFNKRDFFPHLWEEVRYPHTTGQGLYAVPYNFVGSVMYYNIDMFNNAGLAYPNANWTWNTLRESARKLVQRSADGRTTVWGMGMDSTHQMFDPLVRAYGGEVLNASRTKAALNSPQAAEALRFMTAIVREDGSAPPPGVTARFASGQTAIHIMGSWDSRNFPTNGELNWGVQVVPAGPVKRDIYGGANAWEVMKRPNQDMNAVWTVVKELVSPRTMKAFTTDVPSELPARRSAMSEWPNTPLIQVLAQSTQWMRNADFSVDWAEWQAAKRREIDPALRGERPIPEALERAALAINNVLDNAAKK